MDLQGYEAIRDALSEKDVKSTFSPHLFEGDKTWLFEVKTSRGSDMVLETIKGALPGVELIGEPELHGKASRKYTFSHEG